MRKAAVWCIVAFILLLNVESGASQTRLRRIPAQHQWDSAPVRSLRDQGYRLFQAGRYLDAARVYQTAREEARRNGDSYSEIRFLNNLAGCRRAVFAYREATAGYLQARAIAERAGDGEAYLALSMNLSGVYLMMNNLEAAFRAADLGGKRYRGGETPQVRAMTLLQMGIVRAAQRNYSAARPLFDASIREASEAGDRELEAFALSRLGHEYLQAGETAEAELALQRAYRLRQENGGSRLYLCYPRFADLFHQKKQPAEALRWIDLAISEARRGNILDPPWGLRHKRGLILRDQNDLRGALAEFRLALDLARRWRLDVLPADNLRASAEAQLESIYDAFLETAGQLALQSPGVELITEAFHVSEENSAWSLGEALKDASLRPRRVPEEYFELVARLRTAEASMLREPNKEAEAETSRLRLRLTELEVEAGLPSRPPAEKEGRLAIERLQRSLAADEALIAFRLGEKASHRWTVTRESFAWRPLASRAVIRGRIAGFRQALAGAADLLSSAGALHQILFEEIAVPAASKLHWRLVLDEDLFDIPFGALVARRLDQGPVFLAELHTLRVTPRASPLPATEEPAGEFAFLGIGDPVYNRADPRCRIPPGGIAARMAAWFGRTPREPELPRLAGSSRELKACARLWEQRGTTLTLTGDRADPQFIRESTAQGPAVIHIATHMVPSAAESERVLIALGLDTSGTNVFLTAEDISAWRAPVRLVTLSGCGSGAGRKLPGAGLMGLTRAWVLAGAQAVIASHWAVGDASEAFFEGVYRELHKPGVILSGLAAAAAVRESQVRCIHSGNWQARPDHWASFFVYARG